MNSPRNTEPQANYELALALRRRSPDWKDSTVHAERTQVFQLALPNTGTSKRPDILITPPLRQPVIVKRSSSLPARSSKTRPPGWG